MRINFNVNYEIDFKIQENWRSIYYGKRKNTLIKHKNLNPDTYTSGIFYELELICKWLDHIQNIPYTLGVSENFIIRDYLFPIIKKHMFIFYKSYLKLKDILNIDFMNFERYIKNLVYKNLLCVSHSHLKKHLDIFDVSYHLIYLIKNDYIVRLHFFKKYFDVKDKVKLGKINYIEKNTECMICLEKHLINDKDKDILKKSFTCSHHNQICMKCYDILCNSKNGNIRCPMCREEILYKNIIINPDIGLDIGLDIGHRTYF